MQLSKQSPTGLPWEILTPQSLPARILDFDIETRLVGFYEAGRFKPKGSEPIAIACSWIGEEVVHLKQLEEANHENMTELLLWFKSFYNKATMVTGHYITKFDLPILNMSMLEWGLDPLSEKKAQDTKCDLIKFDGFSKSQENLGKMMQILEDKYHMSDADWRRATRLTSGGKRLEAERVVHDVMQHKQLREKLLERGMLKPAKLWTP
jgi:hypothetical protein